MPSRGGNRHLKASPILVALTKTGKAFSHTIQPEQPRSMDCHQLLSQWTHDQPLHRRCHCSTPSSLPTVVITVLMASPALVWLTKCDLAFSSSLVRLSSIDHSLWSRCLSLRYPSKLSTTIFTCPSHKKKSLAFHGYIVVQRAQCFLK